MQAVAVEGLIKRYGSLTAVDGLSFSVDEGEVFGILGPNGAGKTTTLEIVEGLRYADAGSVHIFGRDAAKERDEVRHLVGVQLQTSALIDSLTVGEMLALFSRLHQHSRDLEGLAREMAIEERWDARVDQLSGGQRQRLSLALALIHEPRLLFLDEPTTGLDPQARRALWDLVQRLRSTGHTVVLTTHYMDEAETLCDRVAIIDHGRILAMDTPSRLVDAMSRESVIECRFAGDVEEDGMGALAAVLSVVNDDGRYTITTADLPATLMALASFAATNGSAISDMSVHRPTLEDVFVTLTGRALRD